MRYLSILLSLYANILFAQIDSNLDYNGYWQEVITYEDTTANVYENTMSWIVKSFINPEEVIVAKKEHEHIKIRAIQGESFVDGMAIPAYRYTLNLEFKEGRYRLTFEIIELFTTGQYASTWVYSEYFKKDGILRKLNVQKVKRLKWTIDNFLNQIHFSISQGSEKKESGW